MLPVVNNEPVMSSKEIADVVGSRHDKVKQSMDRLEAKGLIKLTPSGEVNRLGQNVVVYYVNKRDSYIVVAQLSPEFTAALVDRWQELENASAPKLPQTFAEALQLAADQAKQLELQAPKVEFFDRLVDRKTLMTATQVAQKHGKSAIWLNKHLSEHDVYSKAVKRGKVFRQWFIDKGYGEMKQSEEGFSQPLFSPAGEAWIAELIISYGYV